MTDGLLGMLVTLGSAALVVAVVRMYVWGKRDTARYRKFRAAAGKTWFSLLGVLGLCLAALPLVLVQGVLVVLVVSLLAAVLGALLGYLAVSHVRARGLGIGVCLGGVVLLDTALIELVLVPAFGLLSYVIGSGLAIITLILAISAIVRFPLPKAADLA